MGCSLSKTLLRRGNPSHASNKIVSDEDVASNKFTDTIATLERWSQSVPSELRNDDVLRQRLLNAVQRLVPEVETEAEMSQRLLYLPVEIMGAKIGVDLDIFSFLSANKGSLSTEEVAEQCGAEPALLSRVLKYIASLGLIKETDTDLWSASNATKNLAGRHMAAGVNHKHDNVMPAYRALPSWLKRRGYKSPTEKTDTPFAQGHGASPEQSFYGWMKEHPDNAKEFHLFMGVHRTGMKTWLDNKDLCDLLLADPVNQVEKIDTSERVAFVDVGGGIGHQCTALKAKHADLKGRIILQDLPEVIQKANVENGIQVMPQDFFQSQSIIAAKVYYLRSILRNWPDGESLKILNNIRNAMSPDSLLYIDEIVLPDRGAGKLETQLDMTMLAMLNGAARTDSHWRKLLQEAGFRVRNIIIYQKEGHEAVIVAAKEL